MTPVPQFAGRGRAPQARLAPVRRANARSGAHDGAGV